MRAIERKEETKYVAEAQPLSDVPGTLLVPTGLIGSLPKLVQGVQSNQRIGQKVGTARGRVDFVFFLNPAGTLPATATQNVYVKLFTLTSKQARSMGQIALLPGNTLLDQGNQNSIDWVTPSDALIYNQLPLSKEDFSGKAKIIHLIKNAGSPNGDNTATGATNAYGKISAFHSVTWKHNGALLYDDTGSITPTNYAPVFAYVAFNADNSVYAGQVQVIVRKHMWYKDA